MRGIILFILLLTALFAKDTHPAYLYSQRKKCVDYFYYDQSAGRLYYKYSHEDSERSTRYQGTFIPGYEYNETSMKCYIPQKVGEYGLYPDQYNFLLALTGVLSGFTFLFFMSYIFITAGRK